MVKGPGETSNPGAIQPLNQPRPILVEEKDGAPYRVRLTCESFRRRAVSVLRAGREDPGATAAVFSGGSSIHPHLASPVKGEGPFLSPPGKRIKPALSEANGVRGKGIKVASIEDCWRIDDEWWREKPVSRLYFEVLLEDGRRLTVFKDLLQGQWYRQKVTDIASATAIE